MVLGCFLGGRQIHRKKNRTTKIKRETKGEKKMLNAAVKNA